jgi:putative hydrolase
MTMMVSLDGDFHVHSTFSDDAVSTIAENIEAAHRQGLRRLRLIDHVRISTTWVPEFLKAVRQVPVPEGLQVLTGVEAKILKEDGTLDIPADLIVGSGGVDAVVIADHQFPGPDGPWLPHEARAQIEAGRLAPQDALDRLVLALISAMHSVSTMHSVRSAQLAHCFSVLPKIGLSEDDLTDEHLRAWASAAAATGTMVEINEKWACPGSRAIRAALDAGVDVVASTDAHVATDVGVYGRVTEIIGEAVRP